MIRIICPACGDERQIEPREPTRVAVILRLCQRELIPGEVFARFDKDGREINPP